MVKDAGLLSVTSFYRDGMYVYMYVDMSMCAYICVYIDLDTSVYLYIQLQQMGKGAGPLSVTPLHRGYRTYTSISVTPLHREGLQSSVTPVERVETRYVCMYVCGYG